MEHEVFVDDADEGILKIPTWAEELSNEPAPLANWASKDKKKNNKVLKHAYEKEVADIKEKKNKV